MQCHEVRKAIPNLIDGLLDFDEQFAVRQHIHTCDQCYEVFRAYEQDEVAVTQYVHRAPFAPVARNVIDEIERRGRSPWWDAFMTGSYRLASVAGLVLVILVVGAGAFALREMANSNGDDPVQEQPAQDSTLGVASQEVDEDASQSNLIGQDDIPQIVEQLDEHGLVFDVNEVSETEDYAIEYRRVAVDRHLTLVEYRAERFEDDVDVGIHAMLRRGGGGSKGIPFENGVAEGWMVFPNDAPDQSVLELNDFTMDGNGTRNSREVSLDLSALPSGDDHRYQFDNAVQNNGVEVCCLVVERGVAVSTISWDRKVLDTDDVVYLDESMQPVDDPPQLDASADPAWPEITVNGEPLPMLDQSFQIGPDSDSPEQRVVGVLGLQEDGMLEVHNEHMMLLTDGEEPNWTYFQGPWTLEAELQQPEAEPDPTPEPTVPPNVAQDDPTPTPEPTPAPDDEADENDSLRVLVYQVRDGELAAAAREVDYTQDVATAAIQELLSGLTSDEQDFGLATEVPEGTELLDISLTDGVLTVDFSEEFSVQEAGGPSLTMRMAQVVHTLTQFETVDGVDILVEGQPIAPIGGANGNVEEEHFTRADFEDEAPAILLEHPAPGEIVADPIELSGTSNTFEANLQIEILGPSGEQLYRDFATATSGTGTRGTFDVTVPIEPTEEGWGTIRMFEHSARDGSRTNLIEIPVRFQMGESSE